MLFLVFSKNPYDNSTCVHLIAAINEMDARQRFTSKYPSYIINDIKQTSESELFGMSLCVKV